jgi:hypothetical protein
MGKKARLRLIQCIKPSAALTQVHSPVPFAAFLKPFVHKAPQVIQVSFDKVTIVVFPHIFNDQQLFLTFQFNNLSKWQRILQPNNGKL